MEHRTNLQGISVLGVFARCIEDFVLVPSEADDEFIRIIENALSVTAIPTSIDGSSVVGSLSCGNSKGFMVSERVNESELARIRKYVPAKRLKGIYTAAGNNVLVNDTAALVHPNLSDEAVEDIGKFLDVEVHRGTVGGLKTVGMAGCVTNTGMLAHPRSNEFELERLGEIFGLPVDIGTVNLGSPLVGSGLLANSKGYVVGTETTGHEMGRIVDALGYN